jgi:hypothetical protein
LEEARATIRLWSSDFEELAAHDVTLALSSPTPGSPSTIRAAAPDADGGWEVDGIELSEPGNWTVTVSARLGSDRPLELEAPIVIEPNR